MNVYLNKRKLWLKKITFGAICFALCMVLPFITAGIPEIGSALSPMHLPVIICGGILGPVFGGVIGFIAPIFRSLVFGMPSPFMPRAVSMAFELMAYGVFMGVFIKLFPKKAVYLYPALIITMLGGRIVGGITKWVLLSFGFLPSYSFGLFWSGYFVETIPAIIIQIVLVPSIIISLRRANLDLSLCNTN